MNPFDEQNGSEDAEPYDLSQPLEGEPVLDDAAAGLPGEEDDGEGEGAASGASGSGAAAAEGASDESPAPRRRVSRWLPLPLLHELEGEQPPKPPQQPEGEGEEEAAPAADAAAGGRLSEQWRIDLKWIFGIPATAVLILTLAALVMFRLSGEEASSTIVEDTRQQVVADARFRRELSRVDPELLELIESDEFTATLYEDPEILSSMIDDIPSLAEGDPLAAQAEYVRSSLEIFSTITGTVGKAQHIQARSALIALVLLLLLFGIPYFIFSRRLGKIVSPAVSLALASWLPLAGLIVLRGNLSGWISGRPGIVEDYQKDFVLGMVDAFASSLVDAAMPVYRFFSLLALILMGFGLLGLLVVWWRFNESMVPRKKKLRD